MPGFAAKAAATRQLRGESPALQLELFDFDGMTGTDNRKTQVLKTEPAAPADSTQDDNMWTSDQAKMGTICRAPTRKMPEDMRRPDLDVPECCGSRGKMAG